MDGGIFGVVLGGLCLGLCPLPHATTTTIVVCAPVVPWPDDMQKKAAGELRALPADAALRKLVPLAIQQRDLNRRCEEAKRAGQR